jgi:RNA polymerase sigma factor (sigma-70 family)
MTNSPTSEVLHQLCTSVLREAGGLTDRQLLEIFIERRDEAAFEAIVRRHGSMVMGVCYRVLRNRQDAEDAFQAAFLVLVRKAAVITSRELLAGWLYGVAYNTALKAKAAAARRRRKERQATAMLESPAETSPLENDWLPLLDRELNGLPDKYRLPIVLCELQGKSHQEAARELGCPIGTLSGRLSRGRALLAKRLARYGPALTAGSLSAALAQQEVSASVPAAVVSATVKAATAGVISAEIAALTEGVVKAMFLAKLKMVTVILGTAVVLTAAALACTALAGGQPQDKGGSSEKPPIRADDKPDKPKQPAARADDKPGQPDRPKEAIKGLTAKIVVHRKTPDQIENLPLDLVVTNEGDQPVRLCTLCTMANTTNNFSTSFLMRPKGNDSSISPEELEKHTVTAKPGESVTITLPTVTIMRPKPENARGLDGKYRIDAAYFVSPEFAEAHKTWQGYVSARTIIELGGGAKPGEDKAKADKIKPGERIYIGVSPSLPDNPIRAVYEVEATGKVALGPGYGRVIVADMTPEEAEVAIKKSLGALIKNPGVFVSRKPPTPVTEGANPELERRVQQLEKEVRALRFALEELQKKPRGQ